MSVVTFVFHVEQLYKRAVYGLFPHMLVLQTTLVCGCPTIGRRVHAGTHQAD